MIIVNLVGGLGNQIFQLSAALALARDKEKIVLEFGLGQTRLLSSGLPEIFAYELPSTVKHRKTKNVSSKFVSKCVGFSLRRQNSNEKGFINFLSKRSSVLITNCILALFYRCNLQLVCPDDLGFYSFKRTKNIFLNGYFQTDHWASQIAPQLERLRAISSDYVMYQELAQLEKPIVVHIRRGDYKNADTFGLLGADYYKEGITFIQHTTGLKKIWLFSDEPELAKNILPLEYRSGVRLIPELDINSAEMLEIMSLGHAFVIANSTYSWWAAYKARSHHVVAPRLWFKGANPPSRLIPVDWCLVDSNFE